MKFEVTSDSLAAPVYIDRDMWEKVVLNLLSNAFKFTLEGGIHVAVRTSADRKAAELTVTDTGAGIPADNLPKLFDRFYQVGGQKGSVFRGLRKSALLWLRKIVRLHGGDVEVDSEPGRGSRFTVRIPFGIAHLPPETSRDRCLKHRFGIEGHKWPMSRKLCDGLTPPSPHLPKIVERKIPHPDRGRTMPTCAIT